MMLCSQKSRSRLILKSPLHDFKIEVESITKWRHFLSKKGETSREKITFQVSFLSARFILLEDTLGFIRLSVGCYIWRTFRWVSRFDIVLTKKWNDSFLPFLRKLYCPKRCCIYIYMILNLFMFAFIRLSSKYPQYTIREDECSWYASIGAKARGCWCATWLSWRRDWTSWEKSFSKVKLPLIGSWSCCSSILNKEC